MCWCPGMDLGSEVGYHIRHDRRLSNKTRLVFSTDGILLREIQSDFVLNQYSAIVIDEAHERNVNTDVLLGRTISPQFSCIGSVHRNFRLAVSDSSSAASNV